MAIKANSSTILNSYVPPFKTKSDFAKDQILIYDPRCSAFVNVDAAELTKIIQNAAPSIIETIEFYTRVGNGVQGAYILPWRAVSKESLIITIDGIKQQGSAYNITAMGDTTILQFSSPVPNGSEFEVMGIQTMLPRRILKLASVGDGTTDTYVLPWISNHEKSVFITIDGVKQHTASYSFTWTTNDTTTVTLSEPVPDNSTIEFLGFYGFNPAVFKFSLHTGDGIEDTFNAPWHVADKSLLYITIDGVKQHQSVFSITIIDPITTEIELAAPVPLGSDLEIFGFDSYFIGNSCADTCDDVTGINIGTGVSVYNSTTTSINGTQLSFKTLTAGSGISFNSTSTEVQIENTTQFTEFENAGTGAEIIIDPMSDPIQLRSLSAGSGISINEGVDDIEISVDTNTLTLNGLPGEDYARFITNAGTMSLIKKANASNNSTLELYGLRAGSGIVVTRVQDDIIISDKNGGNYSNVSGTPYTATLDDAIIGVAQVPLTVELTSSVVVGAGKTLTIKDETGSASVLFPVTIQSQIGQLIDGLNTISITQPYGFVTLYSNGTDWFTMGG